MSEQTYDPLAVRLDKVAAIMRAAAGDDSEPVGLATMIVRHGMFKKSEHSVIFRVNGRELLLIEVDPETLAVAGELRRPVRESVANVKIKPIEFGDPARDELTIWGSDIAFTDGAGKRSSLSVVEGRSGLFDGEDPAARDQLDRAHAALVDWFG